MQCFLRAIPHKERLATLHAICLQSSLQSLFRIFSHASCVHIFRDISGKYSKIHKGFSPFFPSSLKKSDNAICIRQIRNRLVIFHKNAREYIQCSLRFLFHLTKNLTTHLSHNLCAVLPQIRCSKYFIQNRFSGLHRLKMASARAEASAAACRCSAFSGSCFPNSIARIMGMICSGAVAGSFCCRRCCTAFSQNSSSGSCRNRSPVQRRSRNR